jgi:protein phosphatase
MERQDILPELNNVLDVYLHFIHTIDPNEHFSKHLNGPKHELPVITSRLFSALLTKAGEVFQLEPLVLSIDHPVIVIGDLHGSLFDLIRIIRTFGDPPLQSYLVLGNFIDCGEFSTETLVLLFLLKIFFPQSIFLIRGNCEFFEQCVPHDELFSELGSLYTDASFIGQIILTFGWMPIAATIMDYALAVHAGVPPTLVKLEQLSEIPRPISHFEPKLVEDLMWSEPSEECPEMMPSVRGIGVTYGVNVVRRFLAAHRLSIIIRGHELIECGVRESLDYTLLTVFSASNFCEDPNVQCGVVKIMDGPAYEKHVFPALPSIQRYRFKMVSSDMFRRQQKPPQQRSRRGIRSAASLESLLLTSKMASKPLGSPRGAPRPRPRALSLQEPIGQPFASAERPFI